MRPRKRNTRNKWKGTYFRPALTVAHGVWWGANAGIADSHVQGVASICAWVLGSAEAVGVERIGTLLASGSCVNLNGSRRDQ